jgi:hypothetical protein
MTIQTTIKKKLKKGKCLRKKDKKNAQRQE